MALSIHSKRDAFLRDVLKGLFESVVPSDQPHSMLRTFSGVEGFGLKGWGHEGIALLILSCIQGLPSEYSAEELERLVMVAAIRCASLGKKDADAFISNLEPLVQIYVAERPSWFHCMFFLQANRLPPWVLDRPVLGVRLKRPPKVAWNATRHLLEQVVQLSEITREELATMQAVEVRVKAKGPQEAVSIADQVSRTLRGAYHAAGGPSWSMTGRSKSSNSFAPSPVYLVRRARIGIVNAYIPNVEVRVIGLPDDCPKRTDLLLDRLAKKPRHGSSREVLANAIALFAGASDERLAHHEFLGLWQAIESLSMVEGGDTTKVASSLGNLWRNGNDTVRFQLLALAPIRNKLVHVGEFDPERQSASFLMARIARDAFMQFAQLTDELKTRKQIMQAMSMMTLPPKNLKKKLVATRVVKHIRGVT